MDHCPSCLTSRLRVVPLRACLASFLAPRAAAAWLTGVRLPRLKRGAAVYTLLAGAPLHALVVHAAELPESATTVSGAVTISQADAASMTLWQDSAHAVLNWRSFNIGENAGIAIVQPSSDAILVNRVTGDAPSLLAGQLHANGGVVLINPNGVTIAASGNVVAGHFLASALPLTDDMATRVLRGMSVPLRDAAGEPGHDDAPDAAGVCAMKVALGAVAPHRGAAAIVNHGYIEARRGGTVGLIGTAVSHTGGIIAEGGRIALVGTGVAPREAVSRADRGVVRNLDVSGMLMASDVGGGGDILLDGHGGLLALSGTVDASALDRGTGGNVAVTARHVSVGNAALSVTGADKGGHIDIETTGQNDAKGSIAIDAATNLSANPGGAIRLASAGETWFAGHADASATPSSAVNSSAISAPPAAAVAQAAAAAVAAPSPAAGLAGEQAAEPANAPVAPLAPRLASGAAQPPAKDGGDVWLTGGRRLTVIGDISAAPIADGFAGNVRLTSSTVRIGHREEANAAAGAPAERPGVVDAALLSRTLQGAAVVVRANGDGTREAGGQLDVNAPVTWSADTSLTLDAAAHVVLSDRVLGSGAYASIDVRGRDGCGYVRHNGGSMSLTGRHAELALNGRSYKLLHDAAALRALSAPSASVSGSGGYYALAQTIDLEGERFAPLTVPARVPLIHFDGLGNAIERLRITAPGVSNVGLFSVLAGNARVTSLDLRDASVIGGSAVGAVVGRLQDRASIADVRAFETRVEASVEGAQGGPVGGVAGVVTDRGRVSDIDARVQVDGSTEAGGLIGRINRNATLTESQARGTVRGVGDIGGLIGTMSGHAAVTDSQWQGAVVGHGNGPENGDISGIGGLVGRQRGGRIESSEAVSRVSGRVDVGGLVGSIDGDAIVTGSRAVGTVTGYSHVGGIVGSAAPETRIVGNLADTDVSGSVDVGSIAGVASGAYLRRNRGLGHAIEADAQHLCVRRPAMPAARPSDRAAGRSPMPALDMVSREPAMPGPASPAPSSPASVAASAAAVAPFTVAQYGDGALPIEAEGARAAAVARPGLLQRLRAAFGGCLSSSPAAQPMAMAAAVRPVGRPRRLAWEASGARVPLWHVPHGLYGVLPLPSMHEDAQEHVALVASATVLTPLPVSPSARSSALPAVGPDDLSPISLAPHGAASPSPQWLPGSPGAPL